MTPSEGRLYPKEFHGGGNQVSGSHRRDIAARCDTQGALNQDLGEGFSPLPTDYLFKA